MSIASLATQPLKMARNITLISGSTKLALKATQAQQVATRALQGAAAGPWGVAPRAEVLVAERIAAYADLKSAIRTVIRTPDRPEGLKQALKGVHQRILSTELQTERAALIGKPDTAGFGQLLFDQATDVLAALKLHR